MSKLLGSTNSPQETMIANQDGEVAETWHDVKIGADQKGGGSGDEEELVVENLENLHDTTALIVTREGSKFKIGISKK